MLEVMSRNWWMLLIRGIAAVVFGLAIIFVWPPLVLQTLVLVFAVYAVVDGVFAIISGIRNREMPRWWAVVLEGIIGIVAGIGAFLFPGLALITFLYIVAFWAIATGVMQIIAALQLRKEIDNELWLILGGVLSVIFGIVLLFGDPATNLVTLLWVYGALVIGFGVMLILVSFRLRGMGGNTSTPSRSAA